MDQALATSTPGSLPPGARLGRYQIIRRIAKGGMAELYLARQTGGGGYEKVVALKRVLPHLAEDVTFAQMFLNEAKLAAGLDHSNIVHVVDFGSEGGEHFMVMEYVHGHSVLELLRRSAKEGGLPLACALTIVVEVAAALHYAHERSGPDGRPLGLVHRDVSPSNVLVSFDGDVKLVDFGIAKATAHTRVTRSGAIKGKLAYMAPEQVRGEALDRRADVFALSVVLYELSTGQRCFVAPGEFALINRVAAGRYERPSAVIPGFPPDLEAIIARGLAVDPVGRFATARELQVAIEELAVARGDRLSKVALSDQMHRLFGEEAYPTTATLPPLLDRSEPALDERPTSTARTGTTRRGRGRTTALLAGGALVAGLVLGIGIPRLWDDADPEADAPSAPAEPTISPSPAGNAPVSSPAEADAHAPGSTGDSSTGEDTFILVEDPEPSPAGKRKTRRKPRKPSKKPSSPGTHEYLPPSRRGG